MFQDWNSHSAARSQVKTDNYFICAEQHCKQIAHNYDKISSTTWQSPVVCWGIWHTMLPSQMFVPFLMIGIWFLSVALIHILASIKTLYCHCVRCSLIYARGMNFSSQSLIFIPHCRDCSLSALHIPWKEETNEPNQLYPWGNGV